MRHEFGPAGDDLASALASASRILPTVTTAHLPSAANNQYWPEVYLNHSLVDAEHPGPYTDMPVPKVFGSVSPLDPQLFYRIDDFADDLLKGERSGKYTPIEAATWLEDFAAAATDALARGERRATRKDRPEYRRLTIDIAVAAGLGRFFASKFRAGVLYRIFGQTGDMAALQAALGKYRSARAAWAAIVTRTQGVYAADITVGETRVLRGHWAERLADIDTDLARLDAKLKAAAVQRPLDRIARAIAAASDRGRRHPIAARHMAPASYLPGRPLSLELSASTSYQAVRLHYRQMNQAERWQSVALQADGRRWHGAIPADYTGSPYPLAYYFGVTEAADSSGLYPGLGPGLTAEPYFIARRA